MKLKFLFLFIILTIPFCIMAQNKPAKPLTQKINGENISELTYRAPSKERLNELFYNLPEVPNYDIQNAFDNLSNGNRAAAKDVFTRFATTDWQAAYGLAIVFSLDNQLEQAIEVLNVALLNNPDNRSLMFKLGTYYNKQQNYQKAEEQFIKMVNLDVDDRDAWYELGMLYLCIPSLRNFAEFSMTKVLNLYPSDMNAPFELARLYSREGDTNRALILLDKAVENGFKNRKLMAEDKDLANLRDMKEYEQLMKMRFGS